MSEAKQNTDRELWRDPDPDVNEGYQDVVFVTEDNMLGIKVGGYVQMRPAAAWFRLAEKALSGPETSIADPNLPGLVELRKANDYHLRLEALDRAIRSTPSYAHHSEKIDTAAAFERFLRGERP